MRAIPAQPEATVGRRAARTTGSATAALIVAAAVVVLVAAALVAAGCDMPSTGGLGQVGGSGALVTRDYDLAGFTKVVVDSGFRVKIDQSGAFAVSVTVDDNLVKEHLKVELDGDTLHIGLAPLWRYHDVTTTASVSLPRIIALEVSGASRVTVTEFTSGDPLDLQASGASAVAFTSDRMGTVTLDVSGASRTEGQIAAERVQGEVSGGGTVAFTGSAGALDLDVSGGGHLDLPQLPVQDADLRLSGGARGEVTVTGKLKVEASGGSRLVYAGGPQVNADVSGGSTVEPARP